MNSPIQTALIGAGFIGRVHAKNLSQHPEIDLAYVVDSNEEVGKAIAEQNGAEWLASPDQIFAGDSVDVVWIATPPASHAALLREGRKHFFTDRYEEAFQAEINAFAKAYRGQDVAYPRTVDGAAPCGSASRRSDRRVKRNR